MTRAKHWHCLGSQETFLELGTSREGLAPDEVCRRLAVHGRNEITEKKKRTVLMMVLDQFRDFLIIILIAAAVIAGALGKPTDAVAILSIVALNAIIGFIQEYRAEEAMAALKKMAAPLATVVRNTAPAQIAAAELVPGDLVLLEAGQIVPADLRLVETANAQVDESALTGESVPVEKHAKRLDDPQLPLGDRKNMAYLGTVVTCGRAAGVVVATGMGTEMGRIAALLQSGEPARTPLQQRLAIFGKKLAAAIFAICAVIFTAGLLRGEPPLHMLLTAISLAVAAIPEALPAVITIALAIGAKKLVEKKALIRRLPAVETLGSVTYICSDKTGTLTLNKMTAEMVYADGRMVSADELRRSPPAAGGAADSPVATLLTAMSLSNDAKAGTGGAVIGDPTEAALLLLAAASGFDKSELEKKHPRLAELPFDSDRKLMTTFHAWTGGKVVSFTKGAAEKVLERSGRALSSPGGAGFDPAVVLRAAEQVSADGLRVLGFGMRVWDRLPDDLSSAAVESDLTLAGLAGLMDPPREEAKDAVAVCHAAGITPVMITGDHPATALAIAARVGIVEDGGREVMPGRALEDLPMEDFEKRVESVRVYARVSPEQKLKIVKGLQDRGQFVAMTGDGVNDAPALRCANIGVAMGITGTDVSREASGMILLDDNFATIVKAVEEGRRIYDNILKFIKYSMTSNAGTVWAVFLAPFFGLPLPLLPIQILWMNLLCDSFPGLALTAEPAEGQVMRRPPRRPDEGMFAGNRGLFIVLFGLLIGVSALLLQSFSMKAGLSWQTMVFTALVLGRMAVVLACRSENDSLFTIGVFSNRPLLGAVLLAGLLQAAAVYLPFFNGTLGTVPLTAAELALTLALAGAIFLAIEAEKAYKRKGRAAVPMRTVREAV
ncbi:MAG: cation-translocating P-type ATPase [Elusimicrobiales bacterium]|nr:cation-translocating P-type ATPase [Elusimicrobiales bacterium]